MRTEREHQIGQSYKVYWELKREPGHVTAHGARYLGKDIEKMTRQIRKLQEDPRCWKIVVVKSEPTFTWSRGEPTS